MGRKAFTTESFSKLVKIESNNTMEFIDNYVNISTKSKFKCNKGHIVVMTPNRFRCGDRCKKCSGKYKPTTDEVQKEISELYNDEFIIENEYKNNKSPLFIKHTICNTIFKTNRDNIVNRKPKNLCPECRKIKPFTNISFKERFYKLHESLTLLEEWSDAKNKSSIKVKCNKHNYEWNAHKYWIIRPNNPTGCPICCTSKGEKYIRNFLKKNNINFDMHKKFNDLVDKRVLTFDFIVFINSNYFLIEYDGELHEKPFSNSENSLKKFIRTQEHDKMKDQYCKANNIDLLRINYRDFDKIDSILNDKLEQYGVQRLSESNPVIVSSGEIPQ